MSEVIYRRPSERRQQSPRGEHPAVLLTKLFSDRATLAELIAATRERKQSVPHEAQAHFIWSVFNQLKLSVTFNPRLDLMLLALQWRGLKYISLAHQPHPGDIYVQVSARDGDVYSAGFIHQLVNGRDDEVTIVTPWCCEGKSDRVTLNQLNPTYYLRYG